MSKWNKQSSQISEEFLQNEERRKQMIIEAAKRRKEQQRKQNQLQEKQKKDHQEVLSKHKESKKDAYVKYLRNNMHDQHQQKHRKQKENQEIHSNAKWKKKSPPKPVVPQQQLEALDLQVQFRSDKAKEQKKKVTEEFQKEWLAQQFSQEWKQKQEEQLLGSQLLDSLDLDMGTVNRQKQVKKIMRNESSNQPKLPSPGTKQFQDHLNKLKEMIGYQSTLFDNSSNKKDQQIKSNASKPRKIKPQINEVETFNQLKHKKEAKIMNWAQEDEEEADELFSNCSSRKKLTPLPKQNNQQIKMKKQPVNNLPTIDQEIKNQEPMSKKVVVKERATSKEAKSGKNWRQRSIEKQHSKIAQRKYNKSNENQHKEHFKQQKKRSNSNQKVGVPKTVTCFGNLNQRQKKRGTSNDKRYEQQQRQNKNSYKMGDPGRKTTSNLPPLPYRPQSNNSNATYDIQIDVQSFIKQDLISLNQNQKKLQQDLINIHKNHKQDIKEMFNKYDIRTNYKHSSQITGQQNHINGYSYKATEASIQQSIMNLDNLLIRRDILQKQQENAIPQDINQNQNSKSIINPFSHSDALCQQVLQLAKNVSRFQGKVQEPTPNGYLSKNRRNHSTEKYKQKEKEKVIEKEINVEQSLCQSQQVSNVNPLGGPPSLIEPKQKIVVNKNLLKGLLDDDDLE